MIISIRAFVLACFIIWISNQAFAGSPPNNVDKLITPSDLIREASIGDPGLVSRYWLPRPSGALSADGRHVSSDGRYAAVVINWGDPENRENIAELQIFDISTFPINREPIAIHKFSTTSNYHPITSVKWLSDNKTVFFSGARGGEIPQIYRLNVDSSSLQLVGTQVDPILWYDTMPAGNRIVSSYSPKPLKPADNPKCVVEGCLVETTHQSGAMMGYKGQPNSRFRVTDTDTNLSRDFGNAPYEDPDIEFCDDRLIGGISQDGRFGLQSCFVEIGRYPEWWAEYSDDPEMKGFISGALPYHARFLYLLDFEKQRSVRVSDAPYIYDAVDPVWIEGGRRVILAGIYETLEGANSEERTRRSAHKGLFVFDPSNRRMTRIADVKADFSKTHEIEWCGVDGSITVKDASNNAETIPNKMYQPIGSEWDTVNQGSRDSACGDAKKGIVELFVEQSFQQPPILMARNRLNGAESKIFDPNLWLDRRQLGGIEKVNWTTSDGREWTGGLYYPPSYKRGTRYPLVIQTHGFDEKVFSLSGASANYAGQAIAARGILVLQMSESGLGGGGALGTPEEWPIIQAALEGAIDHLDGMGLIDSDRVGMHGWSRTGPHVAYMITHTNYVVAASAFTATAFHGLEYYFGVGAPVEMHSNFGSAPYGEGLENWLEYSPELNLNRIRTPVFIWQRSYVAGGWNMYSGLRRLGVPAEYWVSLDGQHNVYKVGARMNLAQLLVDWFSFWLQDYEDPELGKSKQYVRWHGYRKEFAKVRETPRPPLLDWTSVPVYNHRAPQ